MNVILLIFIVLKIKLSNVTRKISNQTDQSSCKYCSRHNHCHIDTELMLIPFFLFGWNCSDWQTTSPQYDICVISLLLGVPLTRHSSKWVPCEFLMLVVACYTACRAGLSTWYPWAWTTASWNWALWSTFRLLKIPVHLLSSCVLKGLQLFTEQVTKLELWFIRI